VLKLKTVRTNLRGGWPREGWSKERVWGFEVAKRSHNRPVVTRWGFVVTFLANLTLDLATATLCATTAILSTAIATAIRRKVPLRGVLVLIQGEWRRICSSSSLSRNVVRNYMIFWNVGWNRMWRWSRFSKFNVRGSYRAVCLCCSRRASCARIMVSIPRTETSTSRVRNVVIVEMSASYLGGRPPRIASVCSQLEIASPVAVRVSHNCWILCRYSLQDLLPFLMVCSSKRNCVVLARVRPWKWERMAF